MDLTARQNPARRRNKSHSVLLFACLVCVNQASFWVRLFQVMSPRCLWVASGPPLNDEFPNKFDETTALNMGEESTT